MKNNHKTLLASALLMMGTAATAQENIKLIVGTYTNGQSKGVYTYQFDQQTGKASPIDTLALANPSFLTVAGDGKTIYAVSETSDEKASVSAIAFDSTTGKMKLLKTQPTQGADPCYVETNDNFLLTANYTGGSMSLFPVNLDGTLGAMSAQFKGTTGGTYMPNQQQAHMHAACFTPDGSYVLATDFSADRILKYEITGMESIKEAGVAATLPAGSGPRHITFSTDSRFFYVMSEMSGKVSVYGWNYGKVRPIQEIAADTANGHGGADIHVSPDGKFLYASCRLKNDGIAIFRIDRATGKLTRVGYQPTGKHPRHFNITPNGKFLLCASRDENRIQVFSIDKATGMLTDTGQDIAVDRAVCVKFYPTVMQPGIGDGQFRIIEK